MIIVTHPSDCIMVAFGHRQRRSIMPQGHTNLKGPVVLGAAYRDVQGQRKGTQAYGETVDDGQEQEGAQEVPLDGLSGLGSNG